MRNEGKRYFLGALQQELERYFRGALQQELENRQKYKEMKRRKSSEGVCRCGFVCNLLIE
jgi:hypothetical protein